MREILKYKVENINQFKNNLLSWANQYSRVAYLDSNRENRLTNAEKKYDTYDLLVGVDSVSELQSNKKCFHNLRQQIEDSPDWRFGFFTYDLKNEVEKLTSENRDRIKMPAIHFFRPRLVLSLKKHTLEIHYLKKINTHNQINDLFEQLNTGIFDKVEKTKTVNIKSRISRNEYIEAIEKIKSHIQRGDIYEINFCQEFFAEKIQIDILNTYRKLTEISPMPHSCFYRLDRKYLLSASPERFVKKTGNRLISQPIKGTARRGKTEKEDELIKKQLYNDPKERAENIMVVDLVRNDLSRTAKKSSVKVEGLCKIHTFSQVHQLISTVICEIEQKNHFVEAIKQAFPMGSMTGVPKIRAMKLIEEFESTKRGLYSGAVGYITPEGNFDFNVVIRSILYNAENKYLSFMVGGAITMLSEPEKEYEECLLKAKAIMSVLNCESIL